MPNEPQPGSSQPAMPRQMGTGEGEVPLAPPVAPMNVTVRTMSSDITSAQQSGGTPRPYVPPPPVPQRAPVVPQPVVKAAPTVPLQGTAGVPSPFVPPRMDTTTVPVKPVTVTPAAQTQTPQPTMTEPQKKRGIIGGIVIAGIVIVLAGAGYLFYDDIFTGAPASVVPPVAQIPEPPPVPEPTPEPTPEPLPPVPTFQHQSLFTSAPTLTSVVPLTELTATTIASALTGTPGTTETSIREVAFTVNGNPITVGALFAAVAPTVFTSDTIALFHEDPTVFSYVDTNGSWPGYIFSLKEGGVSADVAPAVQTAIEAVQPSSFATLFATTPGTAQTWKQGKTGTVTNRYLVFTNGAVTTSLNYGWVANRLVISTSYDGFKEAVRRLQ